MNDMRNECCICMDSILDQFSFRTKMEGEPVWDRLVDNAACEVIQNINDFQDILSFMSTSKKLYEMVKKCVLFINSPLKLEIDIRLLRDFKRLISISNNIVLVLKPDTIEVISTLPQLKVVNFILEKDVDKHVLLILQQFSQKDLEIRVWNETFVFILQGSRYIQMAERWIPSLYLELKYEYPELQWIPWKTRPDSDAGTFMMNRSMRTFLIEGDFGLVYPKKPPSENNPPISVYIKRLARYGVATKIQIKRAIILYLQYNKLLSDLGSHFTPDWLINKHFLLPMSLLPIDHIVLIMNHTMTRGVPPNPELYDMPNPRNIEDIAVIDHILNENKLNYVTLYHSDGSIL